MAKPSTLNRSHLRFVGHYLKQYPDTRFCLGEWRRYEDGIWKTVPELSVKREAMRLCAKRAEGLAITNAVVGSVVSMVQAEVFLPDDTFDSNVDLVAFSDCTLVISTGKVKPHSPTDYVTSKLSFSYDPDAQCPEWLRVLSLTNPDNVPFLQEYAGLCLTPEMKYETAVWNWGEPGSGKSTFVGGIENMLGARACTLGLADIERSPFALAQIPGKTLAVSTEQPASSIRSYFVLNALISGEAVHWEQKFIKGTTIRPHTKLMWAMNELPTVASAGKGLFRRVIPVNWQPVEQRDPAVKEAVLRAGPAVFNWAYLGLKRLNARGRFDIPATLLAEQEAYRIENDIPLTFLIDTFDRVDLLDDEGLYTKIQFTEVFKIYRKWCKDSGNPSFSSIAFAKEMQRLKVEKTTIDGRVYFLGLKLKDENTNEIEVQM